MKKKKINSNNLLLLITIVLFFVMYAAGCIVYADKGFTRFQTFLNILINNAGLICITAGMTCVMLTGGIDISVGSVVAMDCMILAVGIEQWGWSSPVLMLFILAIGIVFGVVQGFCISYLEIQPFIVTMAGMFFARGMTAVICKEQVSIVSDKIFTTLSSYKISLPFGGYLNKKGVHPGTEANINQVEPTIEYPWPIIRLAELYLNYAEACVGYGKEGYPEKGMAYLDKVRKRAGLKPVLESWAKAKQPLTSYDGQCGPDGRVMKIVRQERMIELYQENHNFWDIRRWKMGETYFNVKARGLNILAERLEDFAKIVEIQDKRTFDAPRQYLMPIPAGEVSKNPNMVQNPGY